jgi:phosphoribosylamine--glycine ligase
MDSDLAELCEAILDGSLADFPLKWKEGAVCAPVAVADGYPGPYRKGDPVAVNAAALEKTGALLFVAGANREAPGSALRTSGGRVLAVSARGGDADDAHARAYEALGFVNFEGMAYRKDIGREEKGKEIVYG